MAALVDDMRICVFCVEVNDFGPIFVWCKFRVFLISQNGHYARLVLLHSYPTACMVTSDDVISLVLPDSLPTLQALCFPLIGIYAGRLGPQEVKVCSHVS